MLRTFKTPFPVSGDAYTVAYPLTSPKAIEKSIYNLTFRISPKQAFSFAKTDEIYFYGINDYMLENLMDPVTFQDVIASQAFMNSAHAFGGALPFDQETWNRVVEEFVGRLPVTIDGVPEGTAILPGEPALQVTSLSKGFGEIAAILEATLLGQVSIATSSLTMRRHLLAALEDYVREDDPDLTPEEVRFKASIMVHDFGMRASSNKNESAMLGRTHLLVFPGTDTFNAAYQAWLMSGRRPMGTSIPALAHRSVQSFDHQIQCFMNAASMAVREATYNKSTAIVSLVSDCYDFNKTIEGDYNEVCNAFPNLVGVARPDSGDYVENVLKIVTEAKEKGLYTVQKNGRIAMTTRRFIQGDSMDWEKMVKVMEALKANGFSPVNCGIFGVGGWLRNTPTRDTLSAAYKLAAIGKEEQPVVKLSHTRAKMSVPGNVKVVRYFEKNDEPTVFLTEEHPAAPHKTLYDCFYDGSCSVDPFGACEDFQSVKNRVQQNYGAATPSSVWSESIVGIQDATFAKHNRSREDFNE